MLFFTLMKISFIRIINFRILIKMNAIIKISLLLVVFMTGCKSVKDEVATSEIVGIARNEKYGAVLYSENKEVYAISGLQSWDSIYLDKEVKLKGTFKLSVGADKVDIKYLGTFQAQNYSKYYLVENPTWELND